MIIFIPYSTLTTGIVNISSSSETSPRSLSCSSSNTGSSPANLIVVNPAGFLDAD